jgi:hypothetical protein
VLKRILENVIGKASSIPNLDLESMGKRCFALGAFPETAQKNRKFLYAASKELGGGVGDSGLYDQQEQTLQQEERDAKFEKANAKRKRIKIAKGASIESVLPHVPTRPVMEQDKGEAAPNINEESSVSNPLEKAKQKLKKKKREQKQRISFSDQEEGKDERPASQPEEAKKVLRKREPEVIDEDEGGGKEKLG